MSGRLKVLSLYKSLLRESSKFSAYNYRMYALRRIRDAFRENKSLQNSNEINQQLDFGFKNLDIIKRQVIIGQLYASDKLVIEKQ